MEEPVTTNTDLIPELFLVKPASKQALHFVWSLPIAVARTGAETPEMLQEKIDLARSFIHMDEAQRQLLIDRVSEFDGTKVEFYKV